MDEIRYRPSVAAIVQDSAGRILIGERQDTPGGWQFPQGGVEPGESPEAALERELIEELALDASRYTIRQSRGPYRYLFPPGRTKHGFNGQEQQYFLLALRESSTVHFATKVPEFAAIRWIEPGEFDLKWLPEMKREVYRKVFGDFFGLKLH